MNAYSNIQVIVKCICYAVSKTTQLSGCSQGNIRDKRNPHTSVSLLSIIKDTSHMDGKLSLAAQSTLSLALAHFYNLSQTSQTPRSMNYSPVTSLVHTRGYTLAHASSFMGYHSPPLFSEYSNSTHFLKLKPDSILLASSAISYSLVL